jgi:hypothetical protein
MLLAMTEPVAVHADSMAGGGAGMQCFSREECAAVSREALVNATRLQLNEYQQRYAAVQARLSYLMLAAALSGATSLLSMAYMWGYHNAQKQQCSARRRR